MAMDSDGYHLKQKPRFALCPLRARNQNKADVALLSEGLFMFGQNGAFMLGNLRKRFIYNFIYIIFKP